MPTAAFGQATLPFPGLDISGRGRGAAGTQATPPGRGGRGAAAPAATASTKSPSAATGPRDLKYPPLHAVQPPKPVTATLRNGMKLYLVEEHEMPVIGGVVMIRTGAAFDPPERIGLGVIAGLLVRSGGTTLKTGEQVDEALQSLGMTMESNVGETSAAVSFSGLGTDVDASLALLREVLLQPEFRQDRLELVKTQIRNAIAHSNDDLARIGQRELASLIFGKDSPYGWQPDYSSIERVTRLDLKNFHKRYFFPANVMLGLLQKLGLEDLERFGDSEGAFELNAV